MKYHGGKKRKKMTKAKKELYDKMLKIIAKYDLEAAYTIKYSTNIFISEEEAKEWNHEEGWDHREELIDDLSKLFQVDENAETLEDKLRDEHTPTLEELEQLNVPEEREDKSLFKSIADAHIEGVKELNKIFNPKGIKFE